MAYDLIAFDFDGTLVDSLSLFLDVGDQVADRYGFDRVDRTRLAELRGLGARELLRRHRVPLWKLPFIARYARTLMGRDPGRLQLFPGIDAALAGLADSGVTLAILTSNAEGNVVAALGPALAAHIRHFACGTSLFGKGRRMRKLLRSTGVRPERALLIGDEIRDAAAARQAGVPFGAVTWGYTHAEALLAENPAEVFRDPADIARLNRH